MSFLSIPEALRAVLQSAGPDRQLRFMTENACDRLAGRTPLGVELAFNDSYRTCDEVAGRLRTARLIRHARFGIYHSAADRGYHAGEDSLGER